MLFLLSWTLTNKLNAYRAFSQMSEQDDTQDAGQNVRIVGRWHHVGGSGGVCICESDNPVHVARWATNWSEVCDITVQPVLEDAPLREMLRSHPAVNPPSANEEQTPRY